MIELNFKACIDHFNFLIIMLIFYRKIKIIRINAYIDHAAQFNVASNKKKIKEERIYYFVTENAKRI